MKWLFKKRKIVRFVLFVCLCACVCVCEKAAQTACVQVYVCMLSVKVVRETRGTTGKKPCVIPPPRSLSLAHFPWVYMCVCVARLLCMRAVTFYMSNTIVAHTWPLYQYIYSLYLSLYICAWQTHKSSWNRARIHPLTHTHCDTYAICASVRLLRLTLNMSNRNFTEKQHEKNRRKKKRACVCV